MLFLESKTLNHSLDTAARLVLLRDLEERNLVPLIRSQRLRSFEDLLRGVDHIAEMERALAASTESTTGEPYVRGDLFPSTTTSSFLFSRTMKIRARLFARELSTKRTPPNRFASSIHSARTFAVCWPNITAVTGKQARPQCRRAFEPLSSDRTPIRFTPVCERKR